MFCKTVLRTVRFEKYQIPENSDDGETIEKRLAVAHLHGIRESGKKSNIIYTVVMIRPDRLGPTNGSMRLAKVRCKTRLGIFIFAKRCTYTQSSFRPGAHCIFFRRSKPEMYRYSDAKSRKVKHTRNRRWGGVGRISYAARGRGDIC